MKDSAKIEKIVFDLGAVLIDWNPRYLYNKVMPPEKADWFVKNIVDSHWNEKQDEGRTFSEAIEEKVLQYPEHENLIRMYFKRWNEMLAGPIHGTVEIFKELKRQKYPLYALSNWSHETFPKTYEPPYDFLALFDGKVVSGFEGVKKPDPKIYQILVNRYCLEATRTLFIDDVQANIDTALRLGFVTHLFKSPQYLRDFLRDNEIHV